MGNKATEEIISTVRSIVGDEFSDMDIIRAFHMANNDPTAAINIIFDTPRSFRKPGFPKKSEPSNSNRTAEPPGVASSDKQNGNQVENSVSELKYSSMLNNSVPRNEVEGNDSTASGVAEEMGSEWRGLVIYVNAFSGDATTEFPSILQMARGGILADSMGLGKTIMTISLLLTHSERGGSLSRLATSQSSNDNCEASFTLDKSPKPPKKASKLAGFEKLMKQKGALVGGGNLIVCPKTLVGQWKPSGGFVNYVHYEQSRSNDPNSKLFAQSDVVITTYGVLFSEFSTENTEDNGGLFSLRWFRIVLDEAHTIKSSKSQLSIAAAALAAIVINSGHSGRYSGSRSEAGAHR
ncbi:hypothetical protein OROMI_011702 [Orobanche minor]